ncbi:MAG: hypothetical protein ACI9KE_005258 [Polyangiales bacterium]|jgi:hypothetical protein
MSPWWRDPRGGPLGDAADAFVHWRGGHPAHGTAAVAWLSEHLDDFAHDDDAPPSDDERFVEGGGAFLGMVLITEREGRHARRGTDHRVLLGMHGSFDPFGAIDAALDADEPRSELAARIRSAEDESNDTGPTSRVVAAFAQVLRDSPQPRLLRERFDLEVVTDDGIEVNLRRAADTTQEQGESALRAAVAKLASMLPGNSEDSDESTWEQLKDRLVPRLVTEVFAAELKNTGRGELATWPLGHGLRVALQARFETRARYIRSDEVEAWNEDAYAVALGNLAGQSAAARFAALEVEHGPLVVARSGDGLDSARILLPSLKDVLRTHLGESFVIAAPHRDTLLAAPDTEGGRDLLRVRASDLAARAPHAISAKLFRISAEGLQEV